MRLCDLDNNKPIVLSEGSGFLGKLSESGGVGRVIKGVNTTIDVGVGEISRQASKMGFTTTKDGIPPISSTNGKIPSIKIKKMGATDRSHKS